MVVACKVALTFESVDKILPCDIQMQPICQYFHTLLLILFSRNFSLLSRLMN